MTITRIVGGTFSEMYLVRDGGELIGLFYDREIAELVKQLLSQHNQRQRELAEVQKVGKQVAATLFGEQV